MGDDLSCGHSQERPREIELKLELDPDGDRLLLQHPLLRDRLGEERRTISTYFDTGTNDLRIAGLSLRVRQCDGEFVQTVKANPRGSAGLFDRWEWEAPINGPEPDLARMPSIPVALDRQIAGNTLAPVYATHISRRSGIIEHAGSRVEVVVDRGEVVAGSHRQDVLELELELIEGSPRALFDIARSLQTHVPLRLGVLTKSERGQRLLRGKGIRAMKAEPVRLSPEMTALEAFRVIAFSCLRHFRANEAVVIVGRDTDALHQSRVALRRLRSSLSLFRSMLPDQSRRRFQDGLRGLACVLGEARNLDVLLRRRGDELTPDQLRRLTDLRTRAYDGAIGALRATQTQEMMIDLAEWLALDELAEANGLGHTRRIAPYSRRILDRFWKKVRQGANELAALDDEERHEYRIAGKKLRYASEFFSALYGEAPERAEFINELEALQDSLGDLNDLVTERAIESELARHGILLPPLDRKGGDQAFRRKALGSAERAARRLPDIGPFW